MCVVDLATVPEAPMKYWRQLLGPAMVSPHSYCVTRTSHERCVVVEPSVKVALWHTSLASSTTAGTLITIPYMSL